MAKKPMPTMKKPHKDSMLSRHPKGGTMGC